MHILGCESNFLTALSIGSCISSAGSMNDSLAEVPKLSDKEGVKSRELRVNQPVLVRNHRDRKERLVPGVILKKKGPLTYLVKCGQRIRFVHIEHRFSSEIPLKR